MKQKFQVGNLNIVDVNALSRTFLLFHEPSTVTNMKSMFDNAQCFNQDISGWDATCSPYS